MSALPRARFAYLACESMRTPGLVTPSSFAMSCESPWFEWPASTDSVKEACVGSAVVVTAMGVPAGASDARSGGRMGSCSGVLPLVATRMRPRSDVSGCARSCGRLGQPRTPRIGSPSSSSARQTAYCSPRRKPLVPSMGSRHHRRPAGPPSSAPRSMAAQICSAVREGWESTPAGSEARPSLVSVTTRCSSVRASSESSRRADESSSPTMASSGKTSDTMWLIMACEAKSATVTGLLSPLMSLPVQRDPWTDWHTAAAAATARMAVVRSSSSGQAAPDS
mmetsp:Transcript_3554/g.11565  ORF Transcript_3554/g.11565 Transcript_3554/m.11565 type:complete len:280 (+) Transcript_3554:408-1247(+)